MTVKDFLNLTPAEFYYAIEDEDNREMARLKLVGETIRKQTWWLYNIQVGRKDRVKEQDLISFIWDKEPKPRQSIEEMKGVARTIAAAFGGKKKRSRKRKS